MFKSMDEILVALVGGGVVYGRFICHDEVAEELVVREHGSFRSIPYDVVADVTLARAA